MSTRGTTSRLAGALGALVLLCAARDVRAQRYDDSTPPELRDVDVVEHLGGSTPPEAIFRDHEGRMVTLGRYFDNNRPVLLALVYHRCSMLCNLVFNGVLNGLRDVPWTVGQQFQVVVVSIDPRDTPAEATARRARAIDGYRRPGSERGWHFLTGDTNNVRRVADAVGWRYRWDARQSEYAHPAAIMLLTPQGRVARYLYGIQYPPRDLRFGLMEAAQGRQVTTMERVLLWCFHYDPRGRRYVLLARNIMKLGGAATAIALGSLLLVLWRRERRRPRPVDPRGPYREPVASLASAPDPRA